jgi:acyl-CoA synthetase (AMP-forming)/AMP-acid ligase II
VYPGAWADLTPEKAACVMAETGEVITYRELAVRSHRLAHYFRSIGLARGDHVAVVLENHPRFFEVCWAAQICGLYWTPVNWHLTPAEMEYIVADCGARLVITSSTFVRLVSEFIANVPTLDGGIVVDGSADGFATYDDVVQGMPTSLIPDASEGMDMTYSSGTTGKPKGAIRPLPELRPTDHEPEWTRFQELVGIGSDSVYLSPGAPLYHAAPLRWAASVHRLGGTVVIMERFDALGALQAIERYRVTHSQWVPTMFVRMLRLSPEDRSRYDLSTHNMAIHAAAPCPVSVKQEMLEWWGPIIHEYWGSSEGGGLSYITPQEWLDHPGSVGKVVVGTAHILGDDGETLPPGEPGVIFIEDGIPIAYHNDGAKTAAAHDQRGWSTVGDVGYLDADGYLYLTDRRDHMIIAGGVNIYPQEAEEVLIRHPAVADVAVIGVPNAEYGEEVKAVVQISDAGRAGVDLERELIDFCRSSLSAYKCPRSVDFVEELPRAPSGKLYKRRLRDRYWAEVPQSLVPEPFA